MAILRAICIATPNINTVIYSNFKIFFKFLNIFVSALGVTIIGYFLVSIGNGMVFNLTKFTNFFDKTCLGFANSLLQNFYWPWHKPIFSNF